MSILSIKNKIKKIKENNGVYTIEAIVGGSAILMLLLLFVGIISYQLPKIQLQKDVQILAEKCKIQGGLTNKASYDIKYNISEEDRKKVNEDKNSNDIDVFYDLLKQQGFDIQNVKISLKTKKSNKNAIGVKPIGIENINNCSYIKRNPNDLMILNVEVPKKSNIINSPLRFFGIDKHLSNYSFREVVMSERW